MNDSPLIRAAAADDLTALSALGARTFTHTFGHLYEPEQLAAHLAENRSAASFAAALETHSILVAQAGASLVGYIKCGPVGLPVASTEADREIHQLYVDAAQQGGGIGRALMDQALLLPDMLEAPNIFLGVWEENLRAQRFYASYGFEKVGEYLYYVGHHADRELILRRPGRLAYGAQCAPFSA